MRSCSSTNESSELVSSRASRADADDALPLVSVIMPVFNEEKFIAHALTAVLEQDYPPDKLEILVADGMSSDATREIIRAFQCKYPQVRLINNPLRIVPTGLNVALGQARGDVVVRLDGHCEYPNNYVRRVVELRQTLGADNVGGVLVPFGNSYAQRAIAAAYHSPGGFGGSALKAASGAPSVREVDAVHGGCWTRERLIEAGGFDETMVRNQDDELSFRLRKYGGRVVQATDIRVKYHVRNSFRKLFRQFAQYGFWKVQVIRKHPRQASIRHFIPATFVLSFLILATASCFLSIAGITFGVLLTSYLVALFSLAVYQTRTSDRKLSPAIVWALVTMHGAYGLGFICGALGLVLPMGRLFARPTR